MREAHIPPGPKVILCADDFGISDAVSTGIEELVAAGRLSATGCMVTFPEWPKLARRAALLRDRIAVGLHLNLTAGPPMGPMPYFASGGFFPPIGRILAAAGRGSIETSEIEAETGRQLSAFAEHTGFAPDFVDGHQHVHAIWSVRGGVLAAVSKFRGGRNILVRNPGDRLLRILRRKMQLRKAIGVAALALGLGPAIRAAGLASNDGFSGFSGYDPIVAYAAELEAAFAASGPRQLAMCHPGHVDAVLAERDSLTGRREEEFSVLMTAAGLTDRLWRPNRQLANIWGSASG